MFFNGQSQLLNVVCMWSSLLSFLFSSLLIFSCLIFSFMQTLDSCHDQMLDLYHDRAVPAQKNPAWVVPTFSNASPANETRQVTLQHFLIFHDSLMFPSLQLLLLLNHRKEWKFDKCHAHGLILRATLCVVAASYSPAISPVISPVISPAISPAISCQPAARTVVSCHYESDTGEWQNLTIPSLLHLLLLLEHTKRLRRHSPFRDQLPLDATRTYQPTPIDHNTGAILWVVDRDAHEHAALLSHLLDHTIILSVCRVLVGDEKEKKKKKKWTRRHWIFVIVVFHRRHDRGEEETSASKLDPEVTRRKKRRTKWFSMTRETKRGSRLHHNRMRGVSWHSWRWMPLRRKRRSHPVVFLLGSRGRLSTWIWMANDFSFVPGPHHCLP